MTAKCQSNLINFHLERSWQGRYPGTLPETNMFAPLKMEWLEYDSFLFWEKKGLFFRCFFWLLVSRIGYIQQKITEIPNSHTPSAEVTLRDTCLLSIWEVPTPLLGWLDLSSNWWKSWQLMDRSRRSCWKNHWITFELFSQNCRRFMLLEKKLQQNMVIVCNCEILW